MADAKSSLSSHAQCLSMLPLHEQSNARAAVPAIAQPQDLFQTQSGSNRGAQSETALVQLRQDRPAHREGVRAQQPVDQQSAPQSDAAYEFGG